MRKSTSFKIVNCMAPESRVLVLGRASIDYIEKICIKSSKKILLWSWKLPIKIYSNEKKECLFQNCDSMAPVSVFIVLEHGFDDFIVKMQLLFRNLLLWSLVISPLTKVMVWKNASPKIANFIAAVSGLLVLRRGSIDNIEKMH